MTEYQNQQISYDEGEDQVNNLSYVVPGSSEQYVS